MSLYDEIPVGPEMSREFQSFDEFCAENTGTELTYLDLVAKSPLDMDPVTLAFSMRHHVRLSKELLDRLLQSLQDEFPPPLDEILATKGIQLDKKRAEELRSVVFAFRDAPDEDHQANFVKALQLVAMTREKKKLVFSFDESYSPPEEGWTREDFGGDENALAAVRSLEDPQWGGTED
jgi:predicted nucleic acid-binding protein